MRRFPSKGLMSLLLPVLLLALLTTPAMASGGDWHDRYPDQSVANIRGVVYGADRFVAVGSAGNVWTSDDGQTWTRHQLPQRYYLQGLAYANGQYVAVGSEGVVLRSTDGLAWERMPIGTDENLVAVTYGAGQWVAMGGRTILSSGDLINWKTTVSDTIGLFTRVAYTGDQFIAATLTNRGSELLLSQDGLTWSKPVSVDAFVFGFAVGSGQLVTAGGPAMVSTDGRTWRASEQAPAGGTTSLLYADGSFVAVSSYGGIATSVDGLSWKESYITRVTLFDLAYGKGVYVAVGESGTILTSQDRQTWVRRAGGAPGGFSGVVYANGRFVAVGVGKTATSADGLTWTTSDIGQDNSLEAVIFDGTEFVATGLVLDASARPAHIPKSGLVMISPDGVHWTSKSKPATPLVDLAHGDGTYLAVATDASLWKSADAITWTKVEGIKDPVSSVAYGDGKFVAVGMSNLALVSSDRGATWQEQWALAGGGGVVRYLNGSFVEAGSYGAVALSAGSETNWYTFGGLPRVPVGDVTSINGQLLAVNGWGDLWIQDSSWDWHKETSGLGQRPTGMAVGGGHIVVVASDGSITVNDVMAGCGTVFKDVKAGNPACLAVEMLKARHVLNGYEDGTFRVGQRVTRAEFAKMVTVALSLAPKPGEKLAFSDVAGHWASDQGYIQAAVAAKIIQGFPEGTFQPDAPVTRAQVIKIVAAAAGLSPGGRALFSDIRGDEWFAGWAAVAQSHGLIGDSALFPVWTGAGLSGDTPATRGEAAMVLANLLSLR